MSYNYDRRAITAADLGGAEDFISNLKSHLSLKGRQVTFTNKNSFDNTYSSVFVNFTNLEKIGDRAEAENNRVMLVVTGFGKEAPDAEPPTGKVKVEMKLSTLPSQYRLRAKSGTPAQIAKYIADFLNKVVKEVEPRLTHSRK